MFLCITAVVTFVNINRSLIRSLVLTKTIKILFYINLVKQRNNIMKILGNPGLLYSEVKNL